ncbi:MAG: hypothetical protein AAGK71_04705 [Pseudomonadota bacterium]
MSLKHRFTKRATSLTFLLFACFPSIICANTDVLSQFNKIGRIGLGFAFVDDTAVLSKPLPLTVADKTLPLALPKFPDACFSSPGVTSVSGIKVTDASQVLQNTYVIGLAGGLLEVHCGTERVITFPVLQVYFEDAWKRFMNPKDHITNAFLEENLLLLMERIEGFDHVVERSERGGLDFMEHGPLSFGVRTFEGTPHALYFMRFSLETFRDEVFEILSELGCNATKTNDRKTNDPALLIDGGAIDPSAILGEARGMLAVAQSLVIVKLSHGTYLLEDAQSRHSGKGAIPFSARAIAADLNPSSCKRPRHWAR